MPSLGKRDRLTPEQIRPAGSGLAFADKDPDEREV
jgi:hypothetical protein